LVLGVLCIFLYVGAEVSIGSGLTNYLMQDSVMGTQAGMIGRGAANLLSRFSGSRVSLNVAQVAGALVSIYWGLAMVGRFIGSVALARILPGKVLRFNALAAMVLALTSAALVGIPAAAAVLAIGLANSVMFPTIFTLALEDLGEDTPHGSALLCMGIVGGAIIPLIFGAVADRVGLAHALVVPAVCYLLIGAYGWFVLKGRVGQKPA
jgi:FHS family L-fucose permease-like MFS transporter